MRVNVGNKSVDDHLREYATKLGDGDYWLSRRDAAVMCRAISLSLPLLSWQSIKSRICGVLCRFSRLGDRWMIALDSFSDVRATPVSVDALKLLRSEASSEEFKGLKAYAEIELTRRNGQADEAPVIQVGGLYDLLARGRSADSLRSRIRAETVERDKRTNLAVQQHQALGNDAQD